jgi:hypothetical protein
MKGKQRIYRCNCTSCHKAGLLHVRVPSPPDDFLLLSPLDPLGEMTSQAKSDNSANISLSDYTCFDKQLHFLFCPECGGRCMTFAGPSERIEVDIDALGLPKVTVERLVSQFGGRSKIPAWRPSKEKWAVSGMDPICYLSINAFSFDADQDGLDLREWTEKKWVMYLDCLKLEGEPRYESPYPNGAY